MLGKILGALIGERVAGKNHGAAGAAAGVAAETFVKKVVPTIAAVAILAYAYKKTRDFLEEELGGPGRS